MSQARKFQRRKAREEGKHWRTIMHERELAARKRRRAALRSPVLAPDTSTMEPSKTPAPGDSP